MRLKVQLAYLVLKSFHLIELNSTSNIQLSFINNTAELAGTVLYGGNLDHCRRHIMGRRASDSNTHGIIYIEMAKT